MVAQKQTQDLGGLVCEKKPKDLSTSEREECEYGEVRDVYATLLQSDTVQPYGHVKAVTRPVGVELRKKPKDLSASESEERGHV